MGGAKSKSASAANPGATARQGIRDRLKLNVRRRTTVPPLTVHLALRVGSTGSVTADLPVFMTLSGQSPSQHAIRSDVWPPQAPVEAQSTLQLLGADVCHFLRDQRDLARKNPSPSKQLVENLLAGVPLSFGKDRTMVRVWYLCQHRIEQPSEFGLGKFLTPGSLVCATEVTWPGGKRGACLLTLVVRIDTEDRYWEPFGPHRRGPERDYQTTLRNLQKTLLSSPEPPQQQQSLH